MKLTREGSGEVPDAGPREAMSQHTKHTVGSFIQRGGAWWFCHLDRATARPSHHYQRVLALGREAMRRKRGRKKMSVSRLSLLARMDKLEDAFRVEVAAAGMLLEVSCPLSGRTATRHWRLCDLQGNTALHYWPTTGTFRTVDGQGGKTFDLTSLIDMAQERLANDWLLKSN